MADEMPAAAGQIELALAVEMAGYDYARVDPGCVSHPAAGKVWPARKSHTEG
jgi:hypothetical protein